MPTTTQSSIVAAWMVAPGPIVTLLPMRVGSACPAGLCRATWMSALSCTFVFSPMVTLFTSPARAGAGQRRSELPTGLPALFGEVEALLGSAEGRPEPGAAPARRQRGAYSKAKRTQHVLLRGLPACCARDGRLLSTTTQRRRRSPLASQSCLCP